MTKPLPISEEPPDIQRIIDALNALRHTAKEEKDKRTDVGRAEAAYYGLEEDPEPVGIYKPFTADDVNELVQDIVFNLPIDARSDDATETHNFILRNLFRISAGEPSFLLPIRDPATFGTDDPPVPFKDPWKTEAARFLISRESQIRKFPNDPTSYEQASLIIKELRRQDLLPPGDMTAEQANEFMWGVPEFMDEAVLRPTNNLARIVSAIIKDELPKIAAGTSTMVRIQGDLAFQQQQAERFTTGEQARNKTLVAASDDTIKDVLRAHRYKLDKIDPEVLKRTIEKIKSEIATLKYDAGPGVDPAALAAVIENIISTSYTDMPGFRTEIRQEEFVKQQEKDLTASEEAKATAQNRVRNRKEAIDAVEGVFPILEPESYIFDYLVEMVLKEHNDAREQNRFPVDPNTFLPRFRDLIEQSAKRRTDAEAATKTAKDEATRIAGLGGATKATAAVEKALFAAGITKDQITKSRFNELVNEVRRTAGAGFDPIPGLAFSEDDVGAFLQEKQTEGAVKSLTTLFTGDNLPAAIRSQFIRSDLLGPDTTSEFRQHLEGEVIPKIADMVRWQITRDPSSFQNIEDVMAYTSGLTGVPSPAPVPAPVTAPATAPVYPLLEDPYDPTSPMIDSAPPGDMGLSPFWSDPEYRNGEAAGAVMRPASANGPAPLSPGDMGLSPFWSDPEYRARQFGDMPPTPEGDFGLDPFPGMPDNIPASLRTIAEPLYPLEQIMPLLRETAGESPLYLRYLESQIPELQRKYGEERREAFASYNPYGETGGFLPQLREQEELLKLKEGETQTLQEQIAPYKLEGPDVIDVGGIESQIAKLKRERQDIEKGLQTLRRLSGPAGRRYLSSRAPMPTFPEFFGKQLPGIRERYRLTPSGLSDELSQKSEAERTRRRTLSRGKVMVR